MAVALSSLRVVADFDGSGYVTGAAAVEQANRQMADSGTLAGARLAQVDAAAGRTGGTLVSLSKANVDGYASSAQFYRGVAQLQTQMELGNVSAERAQTIYTGLINRFGMAADAVAIAKTGNADFAKVIDSVNAKVAIQAGGMAAGAAAAKMGSGEAAKLAKETMSLGAASAFGNTQFMALTAALRHMFDAIVAGRPPLQAIASEFGNLSYGLSGSGGFMGAIKAMGASIMGMLGPVGMAIVAVGALAAAGIAAGVSWANSQSQIALSIRGIGEAAGATVSEMNQIISASAVTSKLSISQSKDIAAALVQTGRIGTDLIQPITNVAKDLEKMLGVPAKDVGKLLADAFIDPAKGADELNKRLGFLDANMRQSIIDFKGQNDLASAQKLLLEGVASSTKGATEATAGWSRAWDSLTTAASNYWTKFGQIVDAATGMSKADPAAQQKSAQALILQYKAAIAPQQAQADRLAGIGATPEQIARLLPGLAGLKQGLADAEREASKFGQAVSDAMDTASQKAAAAKSRIDSIFATDIVNKRTPDIGQALALSEQLKALQGLSPAAIAAMPSSAQLALPDTIKKTREAIQSLIPEMDKQIKLSNLQRQAVDALSPSAKADIAYKQKMIELSGVAGEKLDDEAKRKLAQNAAYQASGGIQASINLEKEYVSILGAQASVALRVRSAMDDVQIAQMKGVKLSSGEIANIRERAREDALGITAMKQQADTARIEYETIGMATGKATEYRLVQERIAQALRDKQPLTEADIAAIRAQAAAAGQMVQQTEDARFRFETFRGVFQDTLSGIQQGKSIWESFGQAGVNALNKIESKLMDMAINNLWSAAFPAGGGGILGLFGGLFGGGGGSSFAGAGASASFANPSMFANGGIMTVSGALPLHRYASGGVANSPQMAIFAEGSRPEAYVPLPDGRSIPVNINVPAQRGNAGPVIKIYPVAGSTMDKSVDSDGTIVLVGRMIDDRIKSYDKRLPDRVASINLDPKAR